MMKMGTRGRTTAAAMGIVTAVSLLLAACSPSHRRAVHTPPTAPGTTTSSAPSSTTTTPAAGGGPGQPGGFNAVSVSFVSARTGWVLGREACATPPCTRVYRTDDGGRTWRAVNAPPAPLAEQNSGEAVEEVRFANLSDGWVALPEVWATHDGGVHWARQGLPAVYALEAAGGFVHVVTSAPGGFRFRILSSPMHSDAWHPNGPEVDAGAGPVPRAQIVLHANRGWILLTNRVTSEGARLQGGGWVTWKPPCASDGAPVVMAASTDRDLVAHCAEGVWNDKPPEDRAFVSGDASATFHPVPTPLPVRFGGELAAARPTTWVLGASDKDNRPQLFRTADTGRTWKVVYHGEGEVDWTDLGFTTPEQGVVISGGGGEAGRLLMTFDGGATWNPVPIQ